MKKKMYNKRFAIGIVAIFLISLFVIMPASAVPTPVENLLTIDSLTLDDSTFLIDGFVSVNFEFSYQVEETGGQDYAFSDLGAYIEWDDGSGEHQSLGFVSGPSGTGTFDHYYAAPADYNIVVSVEDLEFGLYDSKSVTVQVLPAGGDLTINSMSVPDTVYVGDYVYVSAQFSGPGEEFYSYCDWGDGTFNECYCEIGTCSDDHVFTSAGDYEVKFTVTDGVGYGDTKSAMVHVINKTTNAPEFPTMALPVMLIVGLLGFVLLIRQKKN